MTLRDRLEARRRRIAAGEPPPLEVTVTDAFMDGVGPLKPRVCVSCKNEFSPQNKAQVTCGARKCVQKNNDRQRKKRAFI